MNQYVQSEIKDLPSVIVIGAGPAGLTAAYLLAQNGAEVTVLEADPDYVGGISRTVHYNGFHFDIGGHRFFSKSKEVEDFWDEILPDDMLTRPRSSRIYYRGKFYSYPLKPLEALRNLGVFESILCVLSYMKAQIFPIVNPKSFDQWVSNQFGWRLFNIFFKTYTEKVWGMKCSELSADWAAQRIKGLSLGRAVLGALMPKRSSGDRKNVIKTLINTFRYPRKGPGMMWETCTRKVREMGGKIHLGRKVTQCHWDGWRWTVTCVGADGIPSTFTGDHVISSAPIRALVRMIAPEVAPKALEASASLKYRDFLTVALIYKRPPTFADNWIYIHEPSVLVGRVQNFHSWSPEMVPDDTMSCYGLEYFCQEGDVLWSTSDEGLIRLAAQEMEVLGLGAANEVIDACVVRQPKAYPVYDDHYAQNVEVIRAELDERFPTLHLVGRNGMHKYNNQDHSMMTAMLTVKNILAGQKVYDVWQVNEDAEYHESGPAENTAGQKAACSV